MISERLPAEAQPITEVRATRSAVGILAIQMPKLYGLSAIRKLRADPEIGVTPGIALTALAMPGDRERRLAVGANAYLAKPGGICTLMTTIVEMLARSTTGHPGEEAPSEAEDVQTRANTALQRGKRRIDRISRWHQQARMRVKKSQHSTSDIHRFKGSRNA